MDSLNKNNTMKIAVSDLLNFIFFFIYMEPPIFSKAPMLNGLENMLSGLRIVLFIFIILLLIYKRFTISQKDILTVVALMMLFIVQIVATFMSNGNLKGVIVSSVSVFTPSIWLFYNLNNSDRILKPLKTYLYLLVILNTLSIIFFPNGLITTISMWDSYQYHWILSIDNSMAPYLLTAILFAGLSFVEKQRGHHILLDIIIVFCCVFTGLTLKSSTMLVGLSVFIILFIITFLSKKFASGTHINLYIIIAVAILVLFVLFRKMDFFSYIIENVLQKDLTLTSRTRIWDASIDAITSKPFIGYGVLPGEKIRIMLLASHQHNYYLHILFQGGVIAFGMFCILMNNARRNLNKQPCKQTALISAALFSYFIIFVTEVYGEGTYILPFYVVLIMAITFRKESQAD